HMPALDILLHSSRFEGLSYVFLEALASGVPIVTTHVGGVEELVQPGSTGFVSAARDSESLANLLLTLIDSNALRDRMSVACRNLARDFELAKMITSLISVYQARKPAEN